MEVSVDGMHAHRGFQALQFAHATDSLVPPRHVLVEQLLGSVQQTN